MGKLGSLPEPSMLRIEHAGSRLLNRGNDAPRNPPSAPGKRLRLRDRGLHHLRLLHHVGMFSLVGGGDAEQHALETRTSVAVGRRKIRATVKRLAIGSKKSRERPSTLSADSTHRSLVPAVNVRTLVAIHLHRNEMFIHKSSNVRVVIRLAVHHMATVAAHRANIEQHRLVLALRGSKCLLAPLMPLDGLVHGRAQVSGGSAGESVEAGSAGHASSLYAGIDRR